jgi:hypothetical protein
MLSVFEDDAMTPNSRTRHRQRADAVYNSPNPKMLLSSRLRWVCCVLFALSQLSLASDWRTSEAEIAGKISAITGPGVIALEVNNRSSISSTDVDQIRRGIAAELAKSGVRVWEADQAAATAKVTLSENLQFYVWVAEVQQGVNDNSLTMVSIARPSSSLAMPNAPPLTLRAVPILTQPNPILDFAVIEGTPRRVLTLGSTAITVYEDKDGHWISEQSIPVNDSHPFPRDVRGRIILPKDHLFDAYLPGLVCHSTNIFPLSATCVQSDDPWPLTQDSGLSAFFAPARNFFTGALVPGVGKQTSAPAFYSAAAIPRDKYTLWLFSGVDGQLHLLDGITQQTAPRIHWGSSIAGAHASCRTEYQVLATAPDVGPQDSVQAYEFPDREPAAVSQKFAINGVVTALWSGATPDSANMVYRNSETGNYEAVQLNLACSQ